MIDYNELIDAGYSIQQINQIKKIEYYTEGRPQYNINVVLYINPKISTETLRKVSDAIKNEKIENSNVCKMVLDLVSENKNFDIILDGDFIEEKALLCYAALRILEPADIERVLDAISKNPAFENLILLKSLKRDILSGVDVFKYLDYNFSEQQLMARTTANTNEYNDLIKKINPDNCAYEMIYLGRSIGLSDEEIAKLSYEIDYKDEDINNFLLTINEKKFGYDFGDLLKTELTEKQREFLWLFMQEGISQDRTMKYFNKYKDEDEKLNNIGHIASCLKGVNLKNFFERVDLDFYKDYELETMKTAGNAFDQPLLSILMYNPKPDPEIYEALQEIKLTKREQKSKLSLGRIFYDKICSNVTKYHPLFKLNNKQVLVLAKAYSNKEISETQLDLLRDRQIDPDVLYYLCKSANKGMNIKPYLKQAKTMTKEDAEKLYNTFPNCNRLNKENFDEER